MSKVLLITCARKYAELMLAQLSPACFILFQKEKSLNRSVPNRVAEAAEKTGEKIRAHGDGTVAS